MLHSIKNELCYDEKIEPFPVLAIIDQESNFSIFDTSEDSILQPEIRSSGQPFSIIVIHSVMTQMIKLVDIFVMDSRKKILA